LAAHDPSLSDLDDDASEKHSHKSSKVSPRRSVLHSVAPRELSPYRHQSKVALKQLNETRTTDERMIQEKCARERRWRDAKFEKMINEINHEDHNRVHAGRVVDDHSAEHLDRKKRLHATWNKDVNEKMEYQLWRGLNPNMAFVEDHETVGGRLGHDTISIRPGDDPLKRCLADSSNEDQFRRTAQSIIHQPYNANARRSFSHRLSAVSQRLSASSSRGFNQKSQEEEAPPLTLAELDALWDSRETTRPVLNPDTWGQLHFTSTSYGFFASSRLNWRGMFFTQRRMGENRHLPMDSDGIISGGTLKSRLTGTDDYGILTGGWGKHGQSSLYKEAHGPSTGAPAQDHYTFEEGLHVTDLEFPLGKKVFKHMH